jgi:hypothetical protein
LAEHGPPTFDLVGPRGLVDVWMQTDP